MRRGTSNAGGCSLSALFTTLNYALMPKELNGFAEYVWDENGDEVSQQILGFRFPFNILSPSVLSGTCTEYIII